MKRFEIIPHTADVRLYVEGSSLEELFVAALEGMSSFIKDSTLSQYSLEENINLNCSNTTILLIDFLSDVLTYSQINKAVYKKIEFDSISSVSLKAKIFGEKVETFDEDIKAVTYHEAEVKKNEKGNFETIIVFDI